MTNRITLEPSGHSFTVESSETLLDAGLRAGLNLDHGCANGSCGSCRARLLRGALRPARHADFVFAERERADGWFLLCSCSAVEDSVVAAHEVGAVAEIPFQRVRARVSRLEQLQDDVMQLTLRTPRSTALHFLAGQSLILDIPGVAEQTLPIASCPCDGVQLRFHLRRRPDDVFSDFVFNRLCKGAELLLRGPVGDFTLDEDSSRPLVFVAWETGFASVASLIDHAIQKDENRSIDLYWLSGMRRGHYLSNYCRAWRDILDDFRYHSIDLIPVGAERIDQVVERVVRVHALLDEHDYYLALPVAAVETAISSMQTAGIPAQRIHVSELRHP